MAKPSDGAAARAFFQSLAATGKSPGGAGGGTVPANRPAQDGAGVVKKVTDAPLAMKRAEVEKVLATMSVVRQCGLLELSRSTFYYQPVEVRKST